MGKAFGLTEIDSRWATLGLLIVLFLSAGVGALEAAALQEGPARITYREAYDAGFEDGFRSGQDDRNRNRPFDLGNKKPFQEARRGFDEARHDSEVYTVAYRRGFEDGYTKGFGLEESGEVAVSESQPAKDPPDARKVFLRTEADLPSLGNSVPVGTEFEIELLDTLSTKFSERGDPFEARLVQDVQISRGLIIPEGTQVQGRIGYLKRAGRIRGIAQLNLRFEKFVLSDGRYALIDAHVVEIEPRSAEKVRDDEGTIAGRSSKAGDGKSVGTATAVGGLIGLISGGKGGAAVGAAAGAVVGLANVLITRGRDAQLESRTRMKIRLLTEAKLERPTQSPSRATVPD